MRYKRIQICPKFKIFNCAFSELNGGSSFFVKIVTFLDVLDVLVNLGNNLMFV